MRSSRYAGIAQKHRRKSTDGSQLALADEYFWNFAYSGLRAKDKSFQCRFEFKPRILIQSSSHPQDIGRCCWMWLIMPFLRSEWNPQGFRTLGGFSSQKGHPLHQKNLGDQNPNLRLRQRIRDPDPSKTKNLPTISFTPSRLAKEQDWIKL